MLFLLAACTAPTEAERIAAINKRIAPEGYMTKTHLFIDCPALKQDGEVVAEPLKLKIPLEYLVPGLTFSAQTPTEYAEESLSVHDHKITMVSLRMLLKAKPYIPLLPAKNLPTKEAKLRSEYFKSTYSVAINRDTYFELRGLKGNLIVSTNPNAYNFRECDIAGLERYVQTRCYDFDELKKRVT